MLADTWLSPLLSCPLSWLTTLSIEPSGPLVSFGTLSTFAFLPNVASHFDEKSSAVTEYGLGELPLLILVIS